MGGVPHGGNMWKNIIIGVLTTVMAYVIVHFIFDKKDHKKKEKEERRKIETAWTSVNEYINRSKEKFFSIGCYSCDEEIMKNEIIRELDQMNKSLQNIKDEGGIDEKMKSIIDRTMQMFEDEKPVLRIYYDSLIIAKNFPGKERTAAAGRLQKSMLDQMTHIQTKDTGDINQYLDDLNKKYKTTLVRQDQKLEVNPDKLPGLWEVECNYMMRLKPDHTAFMESIADAGDRTNGKWSIEDKTLQITYDDGGSDTFLVLQINEKMLVLYNRPLDIILGACRK